MSSAHAASDNMIVRTTDPFEGVASAELVARLRAILLTLSAREARILSLHYGLGCEPMTIGAIADIWGTPRSHVQGDCARALRRLRHPRRSRVLRSFLVSE